MQREAASESIVGHNDYLNVTFAKNRIRVPAKGDPRPSDYMDVAMIKIDLPGSVHKLQLNDNFDTIRPGDPIIVMGYPGATAFGQVAVTQSGDALAGGSEQKVIPDPTVNVGNIGRVLKSGEVGGTGEGVYSTYGNVYQVNVANTGPGNSGGPVFDDQGRVVGIFTFGNVSTSGVYYFAVPIRYGMELMGISKVTK